MDWIIACRIRAYANEVASKDSKNEKSEWIQWAKEKADWYDPSVSRVDEIFGIREHTLGPEGKTLQKRPKQSNW